MLDALASLPVLSAVVVHIRVMIFQPPERIKSSCAGPWFVLALSGIWTLVVQIKALPPFWGLAVLTVLCLPHRSEKQLRVHYYYWKCTQGEFANADTDHLGVLRWGYSKERRGVTRNRSHTNRGHTLQMETWTLNNQGPLTIFLFVVFNVKVRGSVFP